MTEAEDVNTDTLKILNPLQIPKLLLKILDYLPIPSLKIAREVSSLWRIEGGKILLGKTYLDVQSWAKIHDENKFQEDTQLLSAFLTSTGQTRNVQLKIYASYPISDLVQEISQLAERVSTLKYCSWIEESEEIAEILSLLPHLEILKTSTLNLSQSQKWLKNSGEEEEKMNGFFTKLNSLREIHLDFDLNKNWLDTFSLIPGNCPEKLENITSIRFHCRSETDLEAFLNSEWTKKWPVKKLRLWFSTKINPKITQKFLLQISNTLQRLHVHGFSSISTDDSQSVPENHGQIWFLPSDLHELKTLKIAGKSDEFIEQTLKIALGFTKLKRLKLEKIPEGFYHRVSSDVLGFELKCESLEKLEIGMGDGACLPLTSLINYSGQFWPNLKSLKIRVFLPKTNSKSKSSVIQENLPFSQWTELDQLELKFQFHSDENEDYKRNIKTCHELILSGSGDQNNGNLLKNLANLKCLQLHLCRPSEEKEFSSDDLITKCFSEMKHLQSLHLVNFVFSAEALEDLKVSLGPYVNIQVTEEEEEVLLYGL